MSSNFDKFFETNSLNDALTFQQVITNIRKNTETKNDKINSIVNQIIFMTKIFNIGNTLGGDEPPKTFDKQQLLKRLTACSDDDIHYLFDTLDISHSESKDEIMINVENAYDVVDYLGM